MKSFLLMFLAFLGLSAGARAQSLAKQTLDGRLTVQVPVLMVEKALGDLNVQLNSGEASKRDGCLKPAR